MKTLGIIFGVWMAVIGPLNVQAAVSEVESAKKDGAKGQITLRVVDAKGAPVIVGQNRLAVGIRIPPHLGEHVVSGPEIGPVLPYLVKPDALHMVLGHELHARARTAR